MTQNDERCPQCGGPIQYDEVDIGVGVMRGNPSCIDCGWSPEAVTFETRAPTPDESVQAERDRVEMTAFVCGGTRCPKGGDHDMSKIVRGKDWESVACAKCGMDQMTIDLMRLP